MRKLSKFTVSQCSDFPSDYVLKLFIRMRLYYGTGSYPMQAEKTENILRSRIYNHVKYLEIDYYD